MNSMCENCDCECEYSSLVWRFLFGENKGITRQHLYHQYSGGYIFFAADSICTAMQILEQFYPKTRTPTHWMPSSNQILTQNDYSRSFKVIRFGVCYTQVPLFYEIATTECTIQAHMQDT